MTGIERSAGSVFDSPRRRVNVHDRQLDTHGYKIRSLLCYSRPCTHDKFISFRDS
jgi:hypothetical protein